MARKAKNQLVEEKVNQPLESTVPVEKLSQKGKKQKEVETTKWDFGHLTFQCFRCGHLEIIQHDVEDGIQLVLPTTDRHEWKLVCRHCGNTMRLFWQESTKKKEPKEVTEDEPKTESKTE